MSDGRGDRVGVASFRGRARRGESFEPGRVVAWLIAGDVLCWSDITAGLLLRIADSADECIAAPWWSRQPSEDDGPFESDRKQRLAGWTGMEGGEETGGIGKDRQV